MELLSLIFTSVGAVATVISTIIAISAKNEAKKILVQITQEKNSSVTNRGNISVESKGTNKGTVTGFNAGDINNGSK